MVLNVNINPPNVLELFMPKVRFLLLEHSVKDRNQTIFSKVNVETRSQLQPKLWISTTRPEGKKDVAQNQDY